MHHRSIKHRAAAALALLLLLSAVSCSAADAVTPPADTTAAPERTAAVTETAMTVTEAAETQMPAVTEAPAVTEDIHADEGTVTPIPIRRTDDWVDWDADYNNPKVKFTDIVEGLISHDVYVGQDGWLFYTDSISDYLGDNLYSDAMLRRIAKQTQDRADWCEENGMTFYFMIAPNKNTVYPDKMMRSMQEGEQKRIDQVYDYLRANTTVRCIDVRDALAAERAANPDVDLYYPLDTHWNNHGAFIAYQAMMDVIQKDFPTARKYSREEYRIDYFDAHFKDCAYYLGYYDTLTNEGPVYTRLDGKTGHVTWHDRSGEFGQFVHAYMDEDGYQESCFNMGYANDHIPDAPSLYIVRDSFFMALSTFLRDSFSEVTSTWTTDFPNGDILKKDPDIVIFEVIEAKMDSVFGSKTFRD